MLNKTKTLTISRQKKAKEKALKWTSQMRKGPYENHSEKKWALQNAKKNNETIKKKSSDRRRLAVSSKNRARQNAKKSKTTKMKFSQKVYQKALTSSTLKTQTSGIFVKPVVFSNNESKPLRRRVLIEEYPAKSSKKQDSQNTDN